MQINKKLEAAATYQDLGLCVMPILTGNEKKPGVKWAELQNRLPTENECWQWWNNDSKFVNCDMGVITGKNSGITIVDFDDNADPLIQTFADRFPTTPRVRTKKGIHFWFAYYKDVKNCTGILPNVDIRNEGGYAKLPPSEGYEWIVAFDRNKLAQYPNDLIPEKLPTVDVMNSEPIDDSLLMPVSKRLEAGREWLNKQDGEKQGNRNIRCYELCCKLVVEFAIPKTDAEPLIVGWGKRCEPEYAEVECQRVLQTCDNVVLGQYGELVYDVEASKTRIKQIKMAKLHSLIRHARDITPEMCIQPEPLVDGMIRVGEFGAFVSDSKIGKSWLAVQLALCVCNGQAFLNHNTAMGNVMYVDNELQHPTLCSRICEMEAATGMSRDKLDYMTLRGDDLLTIAELREILGTNKGYYKLIIIDALYRCNSNVDENSNSEMTGVYNSIQALAKDAGACVLIVHHNSKGDNRSKKVTDRGSGAGSQSRLVDAHITLVASDEDGIYEMETENRTFIKPAKQYIRRVHPNWIVVDKQDANLTMLQAAFGSESKTIKQLVNDKKLGCERTIRVWLKDGEDKGWIDSVVDSSSKAANKPLVYFLRPKFQLCSNYATMQSAVAELKSEVS